MFVFYCSIAWWRHPIHIDKPQPLLAAHQVTATAPHHLLQQCLATMRCLMTTRHRGNCLAMRTSSPPRKSQSTAAACAVRCCFVVVYDYSSSVAGVSTVHTSIGDDNTGSSRRKKRPAQRAHDAEDVYATALCDVPPFKLQRHFFTAQQLPWQGEEDVLSPRASSCEGVCFCRWHPPSHNLIIIPIPKPADASVHREPSMEGQASGSLCGTGAGASLRVGNSMVVNSPPSTPLKLQPVMLTAATPVALRV